MCGTAWSLCVFPVVTNPGGPSHPRLPRVFLIWGHSAPETIQRRDPGCPYSYSVLLQPLCPLGPLQRAKCRSPLLKWMCAMSPQKHPRSNRLHHLGASQPFFKHQLPTLVQVRPHLCGPHSLSHCYQAPLVSPRQRRRQQSPCEPCSCSGISLVS